MRPAASFHFDQAPRQPCHQLEQLRASNGSSKSYASVASTPCTANTFDYHCYHVAHRSSPSRFIGVTTLARALPYLRGRTTAASAAALSGPKGPITSPIPS